MMLAHFIVVSHHSLVDQVVLCVLVFADCYQPICKMAFFKEVQKSVFFFLEEITFLKLLSKYENNKII